MSEVAPAATPTGFWLEDPPLRLPKSEFFTATGMERCQMILRGEVPLSPAALMTGLKPIGFGDGEAVYEMPINEWMQGGYGLVAPGAYTLLADAPLGAAVMTALGPRQFVSTAELALDLLAPVAREATALIGQGKLIHVGRMFAQSSVLIHDSTGRLVGHGTARNLVMEIDPPPPFDPTPDASDSPTPPYLRPRRGGRIPAEVWQTFSGLEIMRQQLAGELPQAPISEFFGARQVELEEGRALMTAPASAWLRMGGPRAYGGAVAWLAESAMLPAALSTAPAGVAMAPMDLKVQYLRPMIPDGREVTSEAQVVHRGKTVAVVSSTLRDADGKTLAIANSTCMVFPSDWALADWPDAPRQVEARA